MTAPKLELVPLVPPTADIYARWRAEIRKRDWSACHIRGDRGVVVDLGDKRAGRWLR